MKLIRNFLNRIRGEANMKKLQSRGLAIGENFKMMEGCIIDPSHCWHIQIGDNVTLAPRVHILAHDTSTKLYLNHTKVANVKIDNNVFIGAGSIILPGVNIGNDVIIGAGSIVSKDIPSNSLALGVPAKVICGLQEYINKEKTSMTTGNTFDESFTLRNPDFNELKRIALLESAAQYGKIYVE